MWCKKGSEIGYQPKRVKLRQLGSMELSAPSYETIWIACLCATLFMRLIERFIPLGATNFDEFSKRGALTSLVDRCLLSNFPEAIIIVES